MSVRSRFAPSPTGYLHIGGARTALFAWLYARHHGGTFILRIEDTDRERSSVESVNAILEGMTWLGLSYDEGPFYQTERFERYDAVLGQMLAAGHAYRCYCSQEELTAMREAQMARKDKPRYDGRCRHLQTPPAGNPPSVIRFRNPQDGDVVVDDLIRGRVVFSNSELDDLVLARTDGSPTYNFTVVVDDMDMGVSCVIRGDDHLNNTPRQINILHALGANTPQYAHVPMILGADGKRLSKRHGAVSVMQYCEEGYLPEALLNYLVRLGWSHGDQEVFTLDELVALFDVERVNRAAAVFNPDKLLWLNQHYLKTSAPEHVARHLSPFLGRAGVDPALDGPPLTQVVLALRERSKTLVEMADKALPFYREFESYEPAAAAKHLTAATAEPLLAVYTQLEQLTDWSASTLQAALETVAEQYHLKFGQLAQPLRVALCGSAVSPAIDTTLLLIGRGRVLGRLQRALRWLETHGTA
ncbi:MAG: glutamate--tRNA ligase [Immundisolibacter sp.]|uniref:glutamate--tRNA ligase n=1 Tax=Immundisolibacter sp. TaxID=1934948 RepID=UPI003EE39E8C